MMSGSKLKSFDWKANLHIARRHWLKVLIAVLLLLAIGGMLMQTEDEVQSDLLIRPKRGPFQAAVISTGELQAKNSVKIYGPMSARQAQIYQMKIQRLVPEGTVVRQGDFVAELDRSELASKIQSAQIELEKALSQHEQTRLDTLLTLSKARDEQVNLRYAMEEARIRKEQSAYEAPSVKRQAEIDFEKAARAYEQAVANYKTQVAQSEAKMREVEATLNKARKDFEDMTAISRDFTILAPENGMVIYKREWNGQKVTTGGTIHAWDPVVAELPDLSQMESITYVNEVDIQKVQVGQPVEIGLDADPDKQLTGTVSHIANIGEQRPNSDAKVFEVKIQVHQADTTLRPAMTTGNTIIVAEMPDVTYIPLEAIHALDSLNYVFVKTGRAPVRQEVALGLMNENEAVVEAGLDLNDLIYLSVPADTQGVALRRLRPEEAAGVLASGN